MSSVGGEVGGGGGGGGHGIVGGDVLAAMMAGCSGDGGWSADVEGRGGGARD